MKKSNQGLKLLVACLLATCIQAAQAITLSLSKSALSPQDLGQVVSFDLTASDHGGAVEYRVRIKGTFSGKTWQTFQDWGGAAAYTWDSSAFLGYNVLEFKARDIASGAIATKRVTFYIQDPQNPPATSTALTAAPGGSQYEGLDLVLDAVGQGGSGDYEHQYRYRSTLTNNQWQVLLDWSPQSSLTVNPLPAADYDFQVRTRNLGSADKHVVRKIDYTIKSATPLAAVHLADPSLDHCLRDSAIAYGWTVVEQVSHLDCSRRAVSTTAGIEALTELNALELAGNALQDIAGVSQLHQLAHLGLSGNSRLNFIDIEAAIRANEALASLNLSGIELLHFPEFRRADASVYGFTALVLSDTSLDDIDLFAFSAYDQLQTLHLANNRLRTTYGAQTLGQLKDLDLSNNQLVDLIGLEALTGIEKIKLSANRNLPFSKIDPIIRNNPYLTSLALAQIDVAVFPEYRTPMGQAYALAELNLDHTRLDASDLHFLASYQALTSLSLAGNRLQWLHGLNSAAQLAQLDVRDNELEDLAGIAPLADLSKLHLSGNPNLPAEQVENLVWQNADLVELGLSGIDFGGRILPLPPVDHPGSSPLRALEADEVNVDDIDLLFLQPYGALEKLSFQGNVLRNLYGLEQLTDLVELNVADNRLEDIYPLEQMNLLTALDLSGNDRLAFPQIDPVIRNNPWLRELGLSGIPIGDLPVYTQPISPYETYGFTRLLLDDTGAQQIDLWALSQYRQLATLSFAGNGLQFTGGIENLPALTELDLSRNALRDLYGLEGFSRLVKLDLSSNVGLDFAEIDQVIRNNSMLTELGLSGISIGDFPRYTQLSAPDQAYGFTRLTLDNTGGEQPDLMLFSDYPHLQALSYAGNGLRFLAGVEMLAELTELDVEDNDLVDVHGLHALNQLRALNLSGNSQLQFADIDTVIRNNPGLCELGLADIDVGEFPIYTQGTAYAPAYAFTHLDLNNTRARSMDLIALSQYSELRSLRYAQNRLENTYGLEALHHLERLDLSDNGLVDIHALEQLNGLTALVLSGNSRLDFQQIDRVIRGNEDLRQLGLSGIAIGEFPNYQQAGWPSQAYAFTHLELDRIGSTAIDLMGFGAYDRLQSLSFAGNRLEFAYGAEQLPQLLELDLSHNALIDIHALSMVSGLSSLNLSGNASLLGQDVQTAVANNPGLTHLYISDISFSALPLPDAWENPGLTVLEANRTGIVAADLHFLAGHQRLERLSLAQAGLQTLAGLEQLPRIDWLDVSGNDLMDIYPVQSLDRLRSLNLSGNTRLSEPDVQMIVSTHPELESLEVSELALPGLPLPAPMPYGESRLKRLVADRVGLMASDLTLLNQLRHLEHLSLAGNQLFNLAGLESFYRLSYLDVRDNQLSDVNALGMIDGLSALYLSGNSQLAFPQVDSVIRLHTGLRSLGLADLAISSLPAYTRDGYQAYALEWLDLDRTGFADLQSLHFYPTIEQLSLQANDLVWVDELGLFQGLQQLDLAANDALDCYSLEGLTMQLPALQVFAPAHCALP